MFVGQQFPSGSCQTRVNGLTRSGNQFIVDYSTLIPFDGTCDIKISQKLLEVSKADLEGVTEIVHQYHKIHLAEMEDYDANEWRQ